MKQLLAASLAVLFVAPSSFAKRSEPAKPSPQVHFLCTSDFKKLCPGVKISTLDARSCLRHMMEDAPEVISMPCRAALHIIRDPDQKVM